VPVNILAVSSSSVTFKNEYGEKEYLKKISIGKKPRYVTVKESKSIYDKPGLSETPVGIFNPQINYAVLGAANDFLYINQNNLQGWVIKD